MAGFFSPNCSRLATLLQTLRRVPFVIEDTFTFENFDPQVNWSGMTASNVMINRSCFLKIWNFLWVSVDITATLAAPFASNIQITIPYTAAGGYDSTNSRRQGGGAYVWDAGVGAVGLWFIISGQSQVFFQKGTPANWAAGTGRISGNFFIEVN